MPKRVSKNKGFTLVEVIVTLVVLVLVAGMGYGAVRGLVGRAEQNARNQTARSLFMAAQTALTHVFANDPQHNPGGSILNVNLIDTAPGPQWADEKAVNGGVMRYLVSNAGDGTRLLELLRPYVDDQTVLEDAIAIEYNCITGSVLSCFYSDETALSYGSAYDLYQRSPGALQNAHIGACCVDYTGRGDLRRTVSAEIAAQLVDYDDPTKSEGNDVNGGNNYGLLTFEIALPTVAEGGGELGDYYCEIEVRNSGAVAAAPPLKFTVATEENVPNTIYLGDIGTSLTGALIPRDDRGHNAWLFFNQRKDAKGRRVLVLVLDSQTAGRDLKALYPEIDQLGSLSADATIKDGPGDSAEVIAEADAYGVHAYFAGTDDTGGIYQIASARHLNHVRDKSDQSFQQVADLRMENYAGEPYAMEPISVFSGTYNGGRYRIENLTMSRAGNAGLFLTNSGSITQVLLYNPDIHGTGSGTVGGIAAVNSGSITNCTVYHSASEPSAGDPSTEAASGTYHVRGNIAGGIAGKNDGTGEKGIRNCYVGIGVQGVSLAGGIAGESSGIITNCEVSTGMAAKVLKLAGELISKPASGAVSGTADSYTDPVRGAQAYFGTTLQTDTADTNQRWIEVTGNATGQDSNPTLYTSGLAGGIVGRQTGGTVSYCVNGAHVGGGGNGVAGGVVGSIDGGGYSSDAAYLEYCYNAGWVQAPVCVGGVAGLIHSAQIYSCYNTAPVNILLYPAPQDCFSGAVTKRLHMRYLPRKIVQTSAVAGGIVGRVHMHSKVSYAYNASYVGWNENNAYAGAFGRVANDYSAILTSCYFLRNILNCSERYHRFEFNSGTENVAHPTRGISTENSRTSVTMLDEAKMQGLIKGHAGGFEYLLDGSSGANLRVFTSDTFVNIGAGDNFRRNSAMTEEFAYRKYYFPVVYASGWASGRFHRTPYYPVRQQIGQINLDDTGDASNYILRIYIPANTDITLRLYWKENGGAYVSQSEAIDSGAPIGSIDIGTVHGDITKSQTLTDTEYLDYLCGWMYEIKLPKSEIDGTDFHAQILGASGMEGYGNIVWSEDD